MLREGKTYLEIAEKTGASTATISRANRSLNYGSDGYDMVFERLREKRKRRAVKRKCIGMKRALQAMYAAGLF